MKQKITPAGDLCFKGILHFFGANLPVHIEILPSGKSIKGEKLYYVYTFLPAQQYKPQNTRQCRRQRAMLIARWQAEKKAIEVLNTIGIVYEREKRERIRKSNKATKEDC